MKKFETPVVELVKFEVMDVVTVSGGGNSGLGENETTPDEV